MYKKYFGEKIEVKSDLEVSYIVELKRSKIDKMNKETNKLILDFVSSCNDKDFVKRAKNEMLDYISDHSDYIIYEINSELERSYKTNVNLYGNSRIDVK